jgi:hypothetical protein
MGRLSKRRLGPWNIAGLECHNWGQQVVAGRAAAISGPSGGSVVDVEARSAIGQILTMFRQHGLIET